MVAHVKLNSTLISLTAAFPYAAWTLLATGGCLAAQTR